MVVLSELSKFICKDRHICCAVSLRNLFNGMKGMCHALTQGIGTIKTFIKYKKCYCR